MECLLIDHENVTRLDRFILADVFISNADNDHFTLAFSDDTDCRGGLYASNGGLPASDFTGRT